MEKYEIKTYFKGVLEKENWILNNENKYVQILKIKDIYAGELGLVNLKKININLDSYVKQNENIKDFFKKIKYELLNNNSIKIISDSFITEEIYLEIEVIL
jgi:hypothetical protein